MNPAQLIHEVTARCAREMERTEKMIGREMSGAEKMAFEAGYLHGHATGQEFALKHIGGAFNESAS